MGKAKATTLAVLEKMHEIVTVGRLNRLALRAAFGPSVSDLQFGRAFSTARRELRAEGYFIKSDPKERGCYVIATAEDVKTKALDTSRRRVVDVARERMTLIQDAQKHRGMDEEAKGRLRTEELLYGRTLQFMERALLKAQRKRPEGLE